MTQSLFSSSRTELSRQARRIFDEHYARIASRCDRMFAVLFCVQWVGGIITALLLSPRSWAGSSSSIHPHVWAAIFLGGLIISLPLALIFLRPATRLTRHVVGIAQVLYSALLIHLSGGRIETHFHVFGSLAFLAFYRDWQVLVSATVVVALDHMLRGTFWTESVFGVIAASPWRWVEHACWVVFEDIFLFMSCVQGKREMQEIATRQADMEDINAKIERQVQQRTAELSASQLKLCIAMEAAETASRSKSEFLANMSHEIRTPMTSIIGYADLLLEPEQNASERLNRVQVIRRNGQHLLTVINDILDISKIEAGRMTVERIECKVPQLLEEVTSLMSPRALEKELRLTVEYDGGVPEAIRSDPTRLRQILLNLVGNAIKFTQRGSVKVVASMATNVDDPNPKLRFKIIDTGVGMSAKQISSLFQPFTQADATTTRRFGGTGLGLTISRRLAQMLGGEIAITSETEKGSCFTLTVETDGLGGVTMLSRPPVMELPQEAPSSPAAPQAKRLAGMRVLLAEDGIDNQALIGHILRSQGVTATIVENGRIACDTAMAALREGNPFDVILMDMQMPELDGYGATSKLRGLGYTGRIFALTAHAMESDRAKCLSAGCDDYATKPIEKQKLISLVASCRSAKADAA